MVILLNKIIASHVPEYQFNIISIYKLQWKALPIKA